MRDLDAAAQAPAWLPIDTAPKDGTAFLALNVDREIWVARYAAEARPRLTFRTNHLRTPETFIIHEINGKRLLERIESANDVETWDSHWTIWTRGYTFAPTDWAPLPTQNPGRARAAATTPTPNPE